MKASQVRVFDLVRFKAVKKTKFKLALQRIVYGNQLVIISLRNNGKEVLLTPFEHCSLTSDLWISARMVEKISTVSVEEALVHPNKYVREAGFHASHKSN